MTDLTEFLRARLDEDERMAGAALPGPWLVGTEHDHLVDGVVYGQSRWAGHLGQVCNVEYGHDGAENAVHIARHDPARVLAEVAAKRRLVDLHGADERRAHCTVCADWEDADYDGPPLVAWPCLTLRLLALPFSDHPDYDESWRP